MVSNRQDTKSLETNQSVPAEWQPFPENNQLRGGISILTDGALNWTPDSRDDVRRNRAALFKKHNLDPARVITVSQVHGSRVVRVGNDEVGRGSLDPDTRIPEADGMITADPGLILATSHADCAPLFLYDEARAAIGLIHAGWRGTLAGIAGVAVKNMIREFGTDVRKLQAAIGPTISAENYEVGEDIAEKFLKRFGSQVVVKIQGRFHLDIVASITVNLLESGLHPDRIPARPPCTFADSRFGSFRREGGAMTGMLAWIALN